MSGPRRTTAAYARALAAALERVRGRPAVFSERDWELAERWRARGVPAGLVIEILEERRTRPPRSLAAIARKVDESWSAVESGRHPDVEPARVSGSDREVLWRRALESGRLDSGIADAVRQAMDALARGDDPRAVDAELAETLSHRAPRQLVDEITRRVEQGLAAHRYRMNRETFERTRDRAVAASLRAAFSLEG